MRILLITDQVPFPPVSGSLLRIYHISRQISRENELWLATPNRGQADAEGLDHMQQYCHKVITTPKYPRSRIQYLSPLLRYALTNRPLEYVFEHHEDMFQRIRQITEHVEFDIIHIEPSYMGLYIEAVAPSNPAKCFLTFHNVESSLFGEIARTETRLKGKLRMSLHSQLLRRWEATYTQRFSGCITVSEEDKHLLLAANSRLQIVVSPNGVNTNEYALNPALVPSPRLLFVGSMNYEPNEDAVCFFAQEILPRVRRRVPDVELWIVGRNPPPRVQLLNGGLIRVTGAVTDVRNYYQRSRVCIVPLRAGGGTRLKILESMALGLPIVSTPKGCEGLAVVDGEHLLMAYSAVDFAEQIVRLLLDEALCERLVRSARDLVVSRYEWDKIVSDLLEVYVEAANGTSSARLPL